MKDTDVCGGPDCKENEVFVQSKVLTLAVEEGVVMRMYRQT